MVLTTHSQTSLGYEKVGSLFVSVDCTCILESAILPSQSRVSFMHLSDPAVESATYFLRDGPAVLTSLPRFLQVQRSFSHLFSLSYFLFLTELTAHMFDHLVSDQ